MSSNIFIRTPNGTAVSGRILRNANLERSKIATNKELEILFDYYNRIHCVNRDYMNSNALSYVYRDISKATTNDCILSKDEIIELLRDKDLYDKVSVNSFTEFFAKVSDYSTVNAIYNNIDGFIKKSGLDLYLEDIKSENIYNIMNLYKKEYGISIVQHIANESGTLGYVRKSYINIIRDKIAENLFRNGATDFIRKFDAITDKMDMTFFSESDASELERLIASYEPMIKKNISKKGFQPRYPKPQKHSPEELELINRSLISQIMNNSDLFRANNKDKEDIKNLIMKYSAQNNPDKILDEFINSDNPKVKQAAINLKNSTFLDYFPIFVASIIAQESQFREFDPKVYSKNGKGIMQITSILTEDMYARPDVFGNFKNRHKEYSDYESLFAALKNPENVKRELHYDAGTAGLYGKFYTLFRQIGNGSLDSLNIDLTNPATIMELVAMNYNGNDALNKKDKKHDDVLSQMRYVYARDVIERFRKYTPIDVKVRHYFDYNPKTNIFNEVEF